MPLFQFKVVLENAEIVTKLRAALLERDRALAELQGRLNHTEYMYGCETHITGELLDLCRHHGIKTRFDKAHGRG